MRKGDSAPVEFEYKGRKYTLTQSYYGGSTIYEDGSTSRFKFYTPLNVEQAIYMVVQFREQYDRGYEDAREHISTGVKELLGIKDVKGQ